MLRSLNCLKTGLQQILFYGFLDESLVSGRSVRILLLPIIRSVHYPWQNGHSSRDPFCILITSTRAYPDILWTSWNSPMHKNLTVWRVTWHSGHQLHQPFHAPRREPGSWLLAAVIPGKGEWCSWRKKSQTLQGTSQTVCLRTHFPYSWIPA